MLESLEELGHAVRDTDESMKKLVLMLFLLSVKFLRKSTVNNHSSSSSVSSPSVFTICHHHHHHCSFITNDHSEIIDNSMFSCHFKT
jgi:hypothetical protein